MLKEAYGDVLDAAVARGGTDGSDGKHSKSILRTVIELKGQPCEKGICEYRPADKLPRYNSLVSPEYEIRLVWVQEDGAKEVRSLQMIAHASGDNRGGYMKMVVQVKLELTRDVRSCAWHSREPQLETDTDKVFPHTLRLPLGNIGPSSSSSSPVHSSIRKSERFLIRARISRVPRKRRFVSFIECRENMLAGRVLGNPMLRECGARSLVVFASGDVNGWG